MSEDRLEELINEMRNESAPPEEAAAAKGRVWQKLAAAQPSVCPEFQATWRRTRLRALRAHDGCCLKTISLAAWRAGAALRPGRAGSVRDPRWCCDAGPYRSGRAGG